MTDLERLCALLDDFGVEYERTTAVSAPVSPPSERHENIAVRMEQGRHSKVGGYTGFFTDFEFTPDGQFVEVQAWE